MNKVLLKHNHVDSATPVSIVYSYFQTMAELSSSIVTIWSTKPKTVAGPLRKKDPCGPLT